MTVDASGRFDANGVLQAVERKDALKAFELLEQMCKDNAGEKEGE